MNILDFHLIIFLFSFFLKKILFFREKEREGERGVEKHQSVYWLPLACPQPGTPNPGMSPDRELNLRPFGLQSSTQPTEPHQPWLTIFFY